MRIVALGILAATALSGPAAADSATFDKARAAVTASLVDPSSAQFEGLRLVENEFGRFVCGFVNARNRMGGYAGRASFVHKADAGLTHVLSDSVAIYEAGAAIVKPCFPSIEIPPTATAARRALFN